MMFSKAKNIDSAFRHVRLFTIIVVCACVVICSASVYLSFQLAARSTDRVYILASGKVLEAYASERRENMGVEARDHVESFHRLFFSLAPDEKLIVANLSKALYLADASAKKQYDNLKESGFYAGLIAGNISQELETDSVQVDLARAPYHFTCRAVQRIIRPTSIVSRSLLTQGYLRPIARSDHNPHGFLIEKWEILENKDIQVQNR